MTFTSKAISVLSYILVLLSIVFCFNFVSTHITSLPDVTFNSATITTCVAAIIVYLIVIIIGGFVWYMLLVKTGQSTSLGDALRIFVLAQFARYIPGNFAHHIGRITLARMYHMHIPRVVFAMSLEIFFGIAACCILTLISLSVGGDTLGFISPAAMPSARQIVLFCLGVASIPLLLGWVTARWKPSALKSFVGDDEVKVPKVSFLIIGLFLHIVSFILMGCMATVLAYGVFHVSTASLWVISGVFSIAWIAGLITPSAPAGLGVRETIMLSALTPIYGAGGAIGITVSMRLITIFGDTLVFLAALATRHNSPKKV